MTPAELTQIVREVHLNDIVDAIGDTAEVTQRESEPFPPAWYLRECQEAERQAFQRGDLRHVYDDTSFPVAMQSGVSGYALDNRILRIREVVYNGRKLRHTTKMDMDKRTPTWRTWGADEPTCFYVEGKTLNLFPMPDDTQDGDAIFLGVYRLPLNPPQWNEEFEWPGDHAELAHWVAHRAFLVPDTALRADSNSGANDMAEYHFQTFNAAFGAPMPHRSRLELLRKPDFIDMRPIIGSNASGMRHISDNNFWRF